MPTNKPKGNDKRDIPVKTPPPQSENDPLGVNDPQSVNDYLLPEHVREKIKKELPKIENVHEGQTARNYIEWLRNLPWNKSTADETNFSKVRESLKKDHFGFDEINEAILQVLAKRRLNPKARGSIFLLVGPPGVGKTSLGESIARAMKRKFVRESLGGLKDEVEFRGHRRTYIASLPGIIIQGLYKAQSKNPVFMLDEVDKIGEQGGEKPAHALVEILDPKQNQHFKDHYVELEFDLSEVLFILTANNLDKIHRTIKDRAMIIELEGYTDEEKTKIATEYVLPDVLKEFGLNLDSPENILKLKEKGLPPFTVQFSGDAMSVLVGDYTSDAGMRQTERLIQKILGKILLEVEEEKYGAFELNIVNDDEKKYPAGVEIARVLPTNIEKYLGEPEKREWSPDVERGELGPGVGVGLAVYGSGQGCLMLIEVSTRKANRFDMKRTGLLGDVMTQSLDVALSRLIHKGGVLEGMSHKIFVHIHADDGNVPKDGPSAGSMVFIAALSELTGVPIKPYFAATGEITLKRKIIGPVGGIKAKLLMARKAGIREVVIPLANLNDLKKFPKENVTIITPETKGPRTWQEISKEPKAKGTLTIYCLNDPELELLPVAFPDGYLPPKELPSPKISGDQEK